jgi:2-furoate---CoA ligase
VDIARLLTWTAERHPDRRAVGGPRPMTYRQWDAHTNQLARALASLGARRGDRIALLMSNGLELASLHLAIQKLGAVAVPLSTRYGTAELAHCLRDCAPRLLVTDASTGGAAERVPAEAVRVHAGHPGEAPPGTVPLDAIVGAQPDGAVDLDVTGEDISLMLYTSGTTGKPKGVPRTHAAEHAATVAHIIQARHRGGEVALGVMPLFHTMGVRSLLASVATGGTWVPQRRFDAEESLELITSERITALYLVPTAYWSLLATGRLPQASSLRLLGSAGAPMTPTLAAGLSQAVRPDAFVNHLGSTEIYTFTVEPDVRVAPGRAGVAGLFGRVRLVATDQHATADDVVPPGEQGQLIVSMRSPEAFGGYWNRPDADAAAIRGGWYFTGDLAVADEEGALWYAGRMDDLINSGGEKIYPVDIEASLARCPAAAEVVVAGLPDERWGQAVTAFVVPAAGRSPEQTLGAMAEFARNQAGLPSLKRPKRIVVLAALPKSAVGKILRRELVAGEFTPLADSATTLRTAA